MRYPDFITEDYPFPQFLHVRMRFPDQRIEDPAAVLERRLDDALPAAGIRSGDRVAVAVGSRGMAELVPIVQTLCRRLIAAGARPTIVPAMGSHGGATPAGQAAVLQSLGVTESSCGAPVRSSLEVAKIATVFDEVPVYVSRDVLEMEHSVCVNRVKPHTKFKAPVESGVFKMLCVGMGKHAGALAYHRWALKYGFSPLVREMGAAVARGANFRFAVATVENARERLLRLEVLPAERLAQEEPRLLQTARKHFPRLPFERLDALVVGQIGKEISGAGMDPNVTGRAYDLMESDFSDCLRATRVAVLALSPGAGGNAIGVGNADIITEKVYREMDYESTVINALTSLSLHKAFIPVRLPDERRAIQACFTTLGPVAPSAVRAVLIRDTRHLTEFWASSVLEPELEKNPLAQVVSRAPMEFDADGGLKWSF